MTDATLTAVDVAAYTVPTPAPEADGTAEWDATTAVVVRVRAGSTSGLGWTYASPAAGDVVRRQLAEVVTGTDVLATTATWAAMVRACRNLGRPGVVSCAIAAVDTALWDLKARLLGLPLHRLLGAAPDARVPVYGSGGFTTMSDDELRTEVEGWLAAGCRAVKIKVAESWGRRERRDLDRALVVRELVGEDVELMVDANGGYSIGQAARMGSSYDHLGVTWFEEPVSSDDLSGLALLRTKVRCDVAAGEYADSVEYAARMVGAGAVDCLQLDVTRCAGYTEWLRCAAVAAARGLQVSGHCAPALHAPVAAAVPNLRHVEWFADHARLEPMLFDGVPPVEGGAMACSDAPGHGMALRSDAERFRV